MSFLQPEWHPKGWGGEKWIVNNSLYCGKILYFMKGKHCSWHYHKEKDETFYVQKGRVIVTYGPTDDFESMENHAVILDPGDTFHVRPMIRHQIHGLEDTELYEFSTPHYEEDSYRVIKGD